MPRMQSSLRPRCTTLAFHERMAAIEASSVGPSKMPQPSMHAYSVPERLTPWSWTVAPVASTRRFPETRRPPVGGAGEGEGDGDGDGDGDGLGEGVGVGDGDVLQPVVFALTSTQAEVP